MQNQKEKIKKENSPDMLASSSSGSLPAPPPPRADVLEDTPTETSLSSLVSLRADAQPSPDALRCPEGDDLTPVRPGILPPAARAAQRVVQRVIAAELVAGTDPRAISDATSIPFHQVQEAGEKIGVRFDRRIELELRQAIGVSNRCYKYLSRKDFKKISAVELSKMAYRHGSHAMRILENQQGFRMSEWQPDPRRMLALRLVTDSGVEAQAVVSEDDTEMQG